MHVIGVGNGPARTVLVDMTNLEILKIATECFAEPSGTDFNYTLRMIYFLMYLS